MNFDKKDFARSFTTKYLGHFVSCKLSTGFRPNEKAEIVGWCIIDNKPFLTIRFKDYTTTHIPANSEDFLQAGYVIRAS